MITVCCSSKPPAVFSSQTLPAAVFRAVLAGSLCADGRLLLLLIVVILLLITALLLLRTHSTCVSWTHMDYKVVEGKQAAVMGCGVPADSPGSWRPGTERTWRWWCGSGCSHRATSGLFHWGPSSHQQAAAPASSPPPPALHWPPPETW